MRARARLCARLCARMRTCLPHPLSVPCAAVLSLHSQLIPRDRRSPGPTLTPASPGAEAGPHAMRVTTVWLMSARTALARDVRRHPQSRPAPDPLSVVSLHSGPCLCRACQQKTHCPSSLAAKGPVLPASSQMCSGVGQGPLGKY